MDSRFRDAMSSGLRLLGFLFLVAGLLAAPWLLGAHLPPSQFFLLAAGGAALVAATAGWLAARREERAEVRGLWWALVPAGLFIGLQAMQVANPIFAVHLEGSLWRLEPLAGNLRLPTGFLAPFAEIPTDWLSYTNPARHLLKFGAALALAMAAGLTLQSEKLRGWMFRVLLVQAAAVSVVTIVHRLMGEKRVLWYYTEAIFWSGSPLFPYRNAAAAYQVLLCGICLAGLSMELLGPRPAPRARGWVLALVSIVALLALLSLHSRFGILMGVALVVMFLGLHASAAWRGWSRQRAGARWAALVIAVAVVLGSGTVLRHTGFSHTIARLVPELGNPLKMLRGGGFRVMMQDIAWEMVKDKPVFGWGGGAYLYLFNSYHDRVPAYMEEMRQMRKNRIFQTSVDSDGWEFLVEYGVVGTTLLAAALGWPIFCWWRRRGWRSAPATLLISAVVLVILHGVFDQTLRNVAVLSLLGTLLVLAVRQAMAPSESSTGETGERGPKVRRRRRSVDA